MKNLVVIGGGTGSYTLLSGLKNYPVNLSAIVTVADSGGSTGRLRDEFGYLPVGDFRMAMVALAASDDESDLLRNLFLYRFSKGEDGLKGHNFGNLFLIALADVLGSYDKALESVSKILRIKGHVIPVADNLLDLVAVYEDGSVVKGETNIDEPDDSHDGKLRIVDLYVTPDVSASRRAIGAILDADYILMGPGDMYTSLLANLVVPGIKQAIRKSSAKIIFSINLMSKYGQTIGFTARDYIAELKKYIDVYPDYVLVNDADLPDEIIKKYEEEGDYPVINDLDDFKYSTVIKGDLLASEEFKKPSGDVIKRSLIRHDSNKLAWEILKIANS